MSRPKKGLQVQGCECGDHVFAALTKGLNTLVSPRDADVLRRQSWYAQSYMRGRKHRVAGSPHAFLARELLGLGPDDGLLADHINGDPLDNRRSNLRRATKQQNNQNRKPPARELPKGVYSRPDSPNFYSTIRADGRSLYLGNFSTIEEAAEAYRIAARRHHGEFARVS